ncbi:pyridoxal-phosphate dependent enzyme [Conyzicola nivalis]|nr:pyridoxal-phosphate dependent enzyme [Conyzicola nivalis]
MIPIDLVTGVTPLHAAPRLALRLGLGAGDLLVKRDDLIGLGGGGNKVRKLQYTCAEAIGGSATVLVTTGAPQSNHARLTAAAAARLGLRAVLVLEGAEPPQVQGNLLLEKYLGASVVWAGDDDLAAAAAGVVAALAADGERPYLIPFGGTSAHSAEGYADAARELLGQLPEPDHVVVAVGSGGTMAGLVKVLGAKRVLGVDCGAVDDARGTVADLLRGMGSAVAPEELRIDGNQIGRGYARLEPATRAAMTEFAQAEGILLDPTYTGRAGAGLISAVRSGEIRPGERTVFLHTGGLPGLFGHPEA